jgi:Protein of unknown function (DUF3119)
MTPSTNPTSSNDIELNPSYIIPLAVIAATIPLVWLQIWVALVVGLFGLFLLVQTALIRLRFTATALEVYRSGTEIRRFPYTEWAEWQIFWPPVPILFYFREVNSIHFLPMLFDAEQLQSCLEQHCRPQ